MDNSPDLAALLPDWELELRAEGKSPNTVRSYRDSTNAYLRWCAAEGAPAELAKAQVLRYVVSLMDRGAASGTVGARLLALRLFSAWLAEAGEAGADQLAKVKQPRAHQKVVKPLSEEELRALVNSCKGGKSLADRRDEAVIRLMSETGIRAGECAALKVKDVDPQAGLALIRHAKGGKERFVAFGPKTGAALARYLRERRKHPLARDSEALWLGSGPRRTWSYFALRKRLQARAEAAGVQDFHPHRLRHTAATRWLAAGGSEGGLMATAGWSSRRMIDRYAAATAAQRAADESRRLNLGDL